MPPPPSLGLGIQTLTEAIQLTPVAPAQAILTTSRNILQIVDADKSESQDRQRLGLLVLEVAVVYSDFMKRLDENERDSDDIRRISSNIFSRLEMISDAILAKSNKRWFTRALGRSVTKKTLQDCEAELQHISSMLQTQIQIRNVKNSGAMAVESESKQAEHELEERMYEAHQETLDLIKSKVAEQRRRKLEQSSFAHIPPAASPIFFGRLDLVNHLVESLLNAPAYHAILGPGGIGKTSLALNVLHDPRIVTAYGNYRYFLACETTADASGVVAGISDIFNINERSFIRSFRHLCDNVKANMLFLLDNFETPWERQETRPKVEELLTQLCKIPNLSIIVTLRGAERPYGVQWTRPFFPIVGPLDFTAARQTFVSIADAREDDADMSTLLQEVDGIPLAITLLASQAQYNPWLWKAKLSRCIGNIHSVLRACLKVDALSEKSVKSAINVSTFRRDSYLGSIALLLEESVEYATCFQKPLLRAVCLGEIGYRMMYNPEIRASAQACLEDAINLLRKHPDSSDLLVSTLSSLTQLLYLEHRCAEGIRCGQDSVRLITASTSPVTSALAYMWLADVLMENRNYQEGTQALGLAASCFEPSKYPILALRYSTSLTNAYIRRSRLSKAIEAADFSLNLNSNMNNAGTRRHPRAALLLGSRGLAYMFLGRYEDAINDFQESINTLVYHNMEHGIGTRLGYLGTARLGCGDFKAASIVFQFALRIPYTSVYVPFNLHMAALELCQDHIDQTFVYCARVKEHNCQKDVTSTHFKCLLLQVESQAHIRRGDTKDALSISILSVVFSYKMPDRDELAKQYLVLGDAYFFTEEDIATAKACYQAGLDVMRYLGNWRRIANALMRLGVVNYLQGESSLGIRRLNQAIGFYEKTSGLPWVEHCKERLRVIDRGIVEEKVPFFPPMFESF